MSPDSNRANTGESSAADGESSYRKAQPRQLKAVLNPEADAVMGSLRLHEMVTFDDRLADIEKAENHGYQHHFRVAAELLAGGVVGAWVTGAKLFPAALLLVVAAVLYLASLAINDAHADSIASFRRDFKRVTDDIQFVESGEDGEAEGPSTSSE